MSAVHASSPGWHPELGPVTEREPVPPLKFAQLVGLVFVLAGVATAVPHGQPDSNQR
jgi:hypothetical protein